MNARADLYWCGRVACKNLPVMNIAMFTSLLVLATLAAAACSSQQDETQGEVSSRRGSLDIVNVLLPQPSW